MTDYACGKVFPERIASSAASPRGGEQQPHRRDRGAPRACWVSTTTTSRERRPAPSKPIRRSAPAGAARGCGACGRLQRAPTPTDTRSFGTSRARASAAARTRPTSPHAGRGSPRAHPPVHAAVFPAGDRAVPRRHPHPPLSHVTGGGIAPLNLAACSRKAPDARPLDLVALTGVRSSPTWGPCALRTPREPGPFLVGWVGGGGSGCRGIRGRTPEGIVHTWQVGVVSGHRARARATPTDTSWQGGKSHPRRCRAPRRHVRVIGAVGAETGPATTHAAE